MESNADSQANFAKINLKACIFYNTVNISYGVRGTQQKTAQWGLTQIYFVQPHEIIDKINLLSH